MATLGRREKQRQRTQLLLTVGISSVVMLVLAAAGYYLLSRPNGLNPETLCPADGPRGHYILLVDKTDPLNFTQKQALSVTLKELIETKVPEGFLVSVFALGEDFRESATPLVELCNPGDGSNLSEWDSSPKKRKALYMSKFAQPLVELSESLVSAEAAKRSPIFEMLQLVGINGYRKQGINGERRLVIVSDMLQNTAQFTMYKGPVDFAAFEASEYGRKSLPDLQNVKVELHYLMNSPQLQTKRNLKFWEDFFARAGARIVAVRPLEG